MKPPHSRSSVARLYRTLLCAHGPQGWWPVTTRERPAYHPGDYRYPRTDEQRWEVCMGAVLTQSTAWTNVERALAALRAAGICLPGDLLELPVRRLEQLVRPAGYFRQKAARLQGFAAVVGDDVAGYLRSVSREGLLAVKGIGPETADSLLLYAAKRPFFVVDAYTRRLYGGRLFPAGAGYEDIRQVFEAGLPRDREIYNEFHALIVADGKARAARVRT
ncbi:MAG: endonuclease III domain-containing protein [Candidatus Aenigmarchaeota archaeon]|nr:endonuclease III domain-containing protein [Candidatus Aenigmarchaeota archaeon]